MSEPTQYNTIPWKKHLSSSNIKHFTVESKQINTYYGIGSTAVTVAKTVLCWAFIHSLRKKQTQPEAHQELSSENLLLSWAAMGKCYYCFLRLRTTTPMTTNYTQKFEEKQVLHKPPDHCMATRQQWAVWGRALPLAQHGTKSTIEEIKSNNKKRWLPLTKHSQEIRASFCCLSLTFTGTAGGECKQSESSAALAGAEGRFWHVPAAPAQHRWGQCRPLVSRTWAGLCWPVCVHSSPAFGLLC